MPVFAYQGYDTAGNRRSGVIDADTPQGAKARLRQQGVLATQVTVGSERREWLQNPFAALQGRITQKEIATFTRQLSTLQEGGLTLVASLNAIIEQAEKPAVKMMVTAIREKVLQGSSLAAALSEHRHFDPLYIGLVQAGEASGSLDNTLERLARFHEARLQQKSKVMAALTYPIIMTIIGSGILYYLLTSVVPKVEVMFADMDQALPVMTVVLLALSRFLVDYWWALLLGGLGLLYGGERYLKTTTGRANADRLLLGAPLFGDLIRAAAIARFCRALNVLLVGGVTLIDALTVTGKVVGNVHLTAAIGVAIKNIAEGRSIAAPLKESGLFPPLVTQMIAAGEETGALPSMLEKVADAYDFEVETAATALTSLLEPLLILVMGSVVGCIVLAILLPIFELSQMAP